MKIKIEKPKESIWKFPCFGIHEKTSKIVAFVDYQKGAVVGEGYGVLPLGTYCDDWEMMQFKPYAPTQTKPKPIDWDKVELPIWAVRGEWIMKIESLEELFLDGLEFQESLNNIQGTRLGFKDKQDRDKYLNSLEILPKGTKITIEL